MIYPTNISPINTTDTLSFYCEFCKLKGTIKLENSIINVDSLGTILNKEDLDYCCPNPKCGKSLTDKPDKVI